VKDLLQEIAEKIAGKYATPSEGSHDKAYDIMRIVTDWLRDQPGKSEKVVASKFDAVLSNTKPWQCPIKRLGCGRNCGNYGCGN